MAKIPSPPNHPFFLWKREFQSCAEEAIFSDFCCADNVVNENINNIKTIPLTLKLGVFEIIILFIF